MDPIATSLALKDGIPVRPHGPPGWPVPDEEVRAALERAYHDGSWGKYHGHNVTALEAALKDYHGVPHALTCGSGTFAVELALRGLGVGEGDEVILAAYDYPGNFLSVHAVGARPVLVDIASHNWNLCPAALAAAIMPATKAIIVSHLHGGVVPMRRVMELAVAHGLSVIEDAAQCPGAVLEGRKAGTWGDAGVLSFGGSKLLTAGRGGAVLTARADVFQRMRRALLRGNLVCPLSELQAAVLLPQLAKLDERNAHRLANVAMLTQLLAEVPGLVPLRNQVADSVPGYYKLGFQYEEKDFGLPRQTLVAALRAEGVAFDEGFPSAHIGRSGKRFRRCGGLAQAERAHHGMLVLHHPVLLGDRKELEEIRDAVFKIRHHREQLRG